MSNEIQAQASPPAGGLEKEQRRTRWLLWLQWVVVSALGFVVAAELFYLVTKPWVKLVLVLVWIGLLALWLVLWRRCADAGWWMVVPVLGLAVAGWLAVGTVGLLTSYGEVYALILGGGLGLPAAFVLGLLQWLLLRRQVNGAGGLAWVPVVAFVAGVLTAVLASRRLLPDGPADPLPEELGFAVSLAVGGAVYGAIIGAVLNVLLPNPAEPRRTRP